MNRIFALLLLPLVMVGCSKPELAEQTGSVGALYNQAMDELASKDYPEAIHTFEELERQHPYSAWATRGQMMIAFAQFRLQEFEESILTAERLIKFHPGHDDLPYLYYLRGMAYYYRISDIHRDQGHTRGALMAFEELINRYPDTIYARDAKLKITLLRDHLAAKEMDIGRYYLQQSSYVAAINRFQNVVRDFDTTSQTPEALYRLVEANLALGLNNEAQRNAAVLGYNYPDSDWYRDAYSLLTGQNLAPAGEEKNWARQLLKGIKQSF